MTKTLSGLKAVIVDDQKVMRSLVRGMLKESGIVDVLSYTSRRQAG